MSSDRALVDAIVERMSGGGATRARAMFGEFGLYCDDRMIGQVCDDILYIKVTDAGAAVLRTDRRASPYPGAKPAFVIEGDDVEDDAYLSELARVTAAAVPPPRKKR